VLEDGYKTQPVDVRYETGQGKGAWVRVIMGEGRKRQIRETCKQLGLPIVRILRIRIGTLRIGGLKPRQWRYLDNDEIKELKTSDARKKEIAKPLEHKNERKKTSRR
jgi:23S rRNA pseudouridine2605 synthase